ncbi:MAG: hypothetical protein H6R07_3102 [Proteobacteria bacterium]|nr:hypothetical protein [Pseudomonadota bacterium]
MKRVLCWCVSLILVSGAAVAADYKIAVVDVDRIMRESGPSIRATKKLEKEFESRRNEMQRITTQGKALEALLDKNGLHEAERKAKERELVKLNQDFQRLQREFNEDRNTRMNEEIAAIQERARQAIKQIAESEKYDLVFQENEILFRSSRIDITEKVIKLLGDK